MKKFFCVLLVMIMMFSMAACGAAASAPEAREPYEVRILSFTLGSFTYVMAMAWADLINQQSDWLTATAWESPSSIASELMMYDNPDMRTNTIYWGYADAAYRGTEQFTDKQHTRSQFITSFGVSLNAVVTCDPNVREPQDLAGRICGQFFGGASNPFTMAVFDFVQPPIRWEDMDASQRTETVLSRRSAATFLSAFAMSPELDKWSGNPASIELLARAGHVGFIQVPQDYAKQLRSEPGGPFEKFYMTVGTIPANSLDERQTEPLSVFINNSPMLADQDMPDYVIEEMLRILIDNLPSLADLHPQAAMLTPEIMAVHPSLVTFHPAAKAYYESIGVTPMNLDDYLAARNQ